MNPQLDAVAAELRRVLGDNLVAIYLHGSLALGGFNPGCSDIDLLIVTRRGLTAAERAAFEGLPRGSYETPGWPRPLELSVLVESELRPWRHPAPYHFHLSSSGTSGPGVDADVAAHITVTRRAGIALYGPPPAEVLPEVPQEDFVASLSSDFEYCVANASRYSVLSMARVWASLAEPEAQHTKLSGGEWALARLPPAHRDVLERTLDSYRTHGRDLEIDPGAFRDYSDFVAEKVRGLRA